MALNRVILSPEYYPRDDKGFPIALGYIYIGEVGKDPRDFPLQISVQQEDGTVVPVGQPMRTNAGGLPTYNGSTVTILVDGNYSQLVQDSAQNQIYYTPSVADFVESEETTAPIDTVQDLRDYTGDSTTADVFGYYSKGDGGGGPARYLVTGAAAGTYVDNGGSILVPTGGDGSSAWLWDFSGSLNIRWFGARTTVDSYEEIQNAINVNDDIYVPDGTFPCSNELTPSTSETTYFKINGSVYGTSVIQGTKETGYVIRLNGGGSEIRNISVTADATRQAAAFADTNGGIHIEAPDVAGKSISNIILDRVRVTGHPGHGIMAVGNGQQGDWGNFHTSNNKGNGLWVHEGTATGRANVSTPSIVTIKNHWSLGNGGHCLKFGDPTDTLTEGVIRFTIINPEYGTSATDAAVRETLDQVWARGRVNTVIGGACEGDAGTTGGYRITGANWTFINPRFNNVTKCFSVGNDVVSGRTDGVTITDLNVVSGSVATAVIVEDSETVTGIDVKTKFTNNITSLMTSTGAIKSVSELNGPGSVNVIKTGTDTVNNSTILVDDSELKFYLGADEFVKFRLVLRHNGDSTADLKIGITVPVGAVARWSPTKGIAVNNTDTIAVVGEQTETGTSIAGAAASARWIEFEGYIDTAAATGEFRIQFAQNVATVADTRLLPGSSLELVRHTKN